MGRLELQFLNVGKTKILLGAKGIYPFGDFEEGTLIFFVYPKAEISLQVWQWKMGSLYQLQRQL